MRALVLGGGGAKGAYEAGAIYHLLGEKKIVYDIYAGTSVGAINASFLAQYSTGVEEMAAKELKKLWFSIDTPMIYRKWYAGLLWLLPVFWKPSAFDSEPLRCMIKTHLQISDLRASKKKLLVGATSITTGEHRIWTEQSDDIADGVIASSAFPGGFEPLVIGNDVYLDDGLRDVTPLETAIKAGATDLDAISLDTLSLDPSFKLTSVVRGAPRVLQNMLHTIDLDDYKIAELYNHLLEIQESVVLPTHIAAKLVGKRRVSLRKLRPAMELPGPLDFSPKSIRISFERGYADAKAAGW
jgi:NTE family protein